MSLSVDLAAAIGLWSPLDAEDRFRQTSWAALTADPLAVSRDTAPAHFTASALPVSPDGRRVCLVLHGRINLWVQPGGHFESHDHTVRDAATREMTEETGLGGSVDSVPLLLSRHRAPCGVDWHLDIQMLAIVSEADPTVSGESADVAWFDVDALPAERADGVDELVAAAVRRLSRTDG